GLATASMTHSGSIPSVGAVSTSAMGGPGGGTSATSDSALVTALRESTTRWAAAASSSMTAGPLELASGAAVMSIGGFNGSDSAITLEQFQALVASGQIHYFIADGMGGGQGGPGGGQGSTWSSISAWVTSTYTATTLGGTTVYDLTASA
ncbi:MAG: glycosyl transferase, partial [Candidatus Lutibacillus vidarii]